MGQKDGSVDPQGVLARLRLCRNEHRASLAIGPHAGRLAGLSDAPLPGQPPRHGDARVQGVIIAALNRRPQIFLPQLNITSILLRSC